MPSKRRPPLSFSIIFCVFAASLMIAGLYLMYTQDEVTLPHTLVVLMGFVLLILGTGPFTGLSISRLSVGGKEGTQVEFQATEKVDIKKKALDDEVLKERTEFAETITSDLPNRNAPKFTPFDPDVGKALKLNPSGFSKVPMYLLDTAFRILDWNDAFSLVFDRTMEGQVGQSVLRWTMHLKNFKDVTQEGIRAFGDPNNLPHFHKERIEYESLRYGEFSGIKRAYALPDDEGRTIAWLVAIEPRFSNFKVRERYKLDIVRMLEQDLMWSEYALLYDRVLTRTTLYPDLIRHMVGDVGVLDVPKSGSRILDLGAGTGNVAEYLINCSRNYQVVAIENNRTMMEILHDKCDQFLAHSDDGPGVRIVKQDATSLTGIEDNYFDMVLLNNVLYAIEDYQACLNEVFRVLRPGGEVRISGPHKNSDARKLFKHIREDLQDNGEYNRLEDIFKRVEWINTYQLLPKAHKFTVEELSDILVSTGFSKVDAAHYEIYRGQSMLVAATK